MAWIGKPFIIYIIFILLCFILKITDILNIMKGIKTAIALSLLYNWAYISASVTSVISVSINFS